MRIEHIAMYVVDLKRRPTMQYNEETGISAILMQIFLTVFAVIFS